MPLLFIIVVGLFYDDIEHMERLEGIQQGAALTADTVNVVGYADDIAIYIAHQPMQTIA